jgi:hypothetical protein
MKTVFFVIISVLLISCSKDYTINTAALNWSGFLPLRDSTRNKVKAEITKSGTYTQFIALGDFTSFYKDASAVSPDSSLISFTGNAGNIFLQVDLKNIMAGGTYNFGYYPGQRKVIRASCRYEGITYINDSTVLSGSITIDSLTTSRLKGSFNVICRNGTNSVNITNGTFAGDLW